MKIMDLKKYTKFIVVDRDVKVPPGAPEDEGFTVYSMGKLDGMYCNCVDKDMTRYYFAAWTEVEVVEE